MGFDPDTLAAGRLSSQPFPHYRFVPGRHPHPTADPAGHSYHPPGESPPRVRWIAPEDWRRSPDYLYGCDLYNHGYWWEAHEAWEGLWQLCDKRAEQGYFLQGLIQVSACHLKRYVGQVDGVRRLFASSLGYFKRAGARAGGTYIGLDVSAFMASVEQYYSGAVSEAAVAPHDPARYPYVSLKRGSHD